MSKKQTNNDFQLLFHSFSNPKIAKVSCKPMHVSCHLHKKCRI